MNLTEIFKEVTKSIGKGKGVDNVYMYLSKVFNKIQHGTVGWKVSFKMN